MKNKMKSYKSLKFALHTRVGLLGICAFASFQVAALDVQFLYIGDDADTSYIGAKQGLYEANLLGSFLGQNYTMNHISSIAKVHMHDLPGYSIILTALDDPEAFKNISRRAPSHPVFNLTIEDDALRKSCLPNAFHTIPSSSMKRDAVKQYLKKKPTSKATAQAWHPGFIKFAARDLNKRYKANAGIPMDDAAWAGWAAVKLTADAVARTNSNEPSTLMNYIKTSLKFDGQKGSSLNFRETGQLRQPLLLVENGAIVAEAPVRGVAKSLDSLGLQRCR